MNNIHNYFASYMMAYYFVGCKTKLVGLMLVDIESQDTVK